MDISFYVLLCCTQCYYFEQLLTGCQKEGLELISIQEYSGLKVATVKSSAIADNITGEKSTRMLTIYLPPGYESNDDEYPVVYYFPGLLQTPLHIKKIVPTLNSYFQAHPENRFIIVSVDIESSCGHSFCRNNPLISRWEDFATYEVTQFVEENFRVKKSRQATGIVGYSGGGNATLHIGFKNPETYSAIFATSPPMAPHNTPEAFITDVDLRKQRIHLTTMAHETLIESAHPSEETSIDKALSQEAINTMLTGPQFSEMSELIDTRTGYQWTTNLVDTMINKKKDTAVYIGYGTMEEPWLRQACTDFAEVCKAHELPIVLNEFEGSHSTYHLYVQFEENLLPFFSEHFGRYSK